MAGKRDLDPGASPLHFGAEVRRAREAVGMTLAELGARVPCDASTVLRVESGLLSPSERFAEACDEAFPQMGGWFGRFYRASLNWDGPYPRWFEDWVDAEGRASVLRGGSRCWSRDCCRPRSTLGCCSGHGGPMTMRTRSSSSSRRGWTGTVFDRSSPPSFWAVLDEVVLRRRVGGAKVMHAQLLHLADMAERAAIKIHVIPAEVGATWGYWVHLPSQTSAGRAGYRLFESPDEGRPPGIR